jgi:hypothetical protein
MLRITRKDYRDHILVSIEGHLAGDDVETAESMCTKVLSMNTRVTVFLKGVTEIDDNGHAFLKRLVMTKARLRALGIYSRYIVRNLLLHKSQSD